MIAELAVQIAGGILAFLVADMIVGRLQKALWRTEDGKVQ